jgi:hypothetical protein
MSSYKTSLASYYGEQGQRRHSLTNYCNQGYMTDSQTGVQLSDKMCVDAERCAKLRYSGRKVLWEPSARGNMI